MFKSRRSFIKHAIVLPAFSFAVVACSLGNTQTVTESSTVGSTDAASPVAEEPIKIRIAYPSGMNGQIATTMEKAEIAKKYGLDAEFIFFQYGPPMMEALASGDVDTVITSLMPVTNFLSRNPGQAEVVANLGASSYSLMVPEDSAIQEPSDLQGKKIAVSFGSDSHLDLLRLLDESRLDAESDVELLNTPPNELQLALEQGFADAIVIRQPQVLNMQETFNARIVYTWPFKFVSIARSQFLAENPEAEEKYVNALQDAVFYIATNKEQASIWFSEQLRLEPAVIREVSKDDPNYNVAKLEDVNVKITPEVKAMLEDWGIDALGTGMINQEVNWGWK